MIAVVGLGFVGLTTALGFAEKGFKVTGFDNDAAKMHEYLQQRVPIREPALQEMLSKHLGTNFTLARDVAGAVVDSEVVFYCVGTPSLENGEADLSQLLGALDETTAALARRGDYKVLVIKSTVPPGSTSGRFALHVQQKGFVPGTDVGIANNPEFLREGHAWEDFMKPDRIVVGTADRKSAKILQRIYGGFDAPIHSVSLNTAEFVKYLSNSMLATMISFSNEMSMIAHHIGSIDLASAFRILHEDRRWFGRPANMATYVYPGCGYGGYCLPKDVRALHRAAAQRGYEAKLIGEVIRTNDEISNFLVNIACAELSTDATIGILGLAFKAHSDDVRDSPAAMVIRRLQARGFDRIVGYDPVASEAFAREYHFAMRYASSIEEVVEHAERTVILTAWPVFKEAAPLFEGKDVYDFRYFVA